ncbi:MAG TPA: M23 family metallopeptidase [Arthrobacter sp.]|nr:M23 family metallopeptidase [Arthrobacter sp.]
MGPRTLDPDASAASSRAAGTPSAFTADALALVAFSRSTVETTSKEGGGELTVASASLKRPPLGFLMSPLEAPAESSPFGLRTSPLTGSPHEFHWGQDYAAACGTRVYSADAGVVRAVGWHPWGGGNRVEIDHGNGLITTYNHLEAIAVKKGDSVRVDEVIARVGTTGSSTGCHLHFETILNGSHSDPHDWTMLPTRQVDQLGTIEMTSYAPDVDKTSNASLGWAIPVREDLTHVVAGGAEERSVAAEAARQPATASPAATEAAPTAPTATPPVAPPPVAAGPTTPPVTTPPVTAGPATPPVTTPPATTPPVTPPPVTAGPTTPPVMTPPVTPTPTPSVPDSGAAPPPASTPPPPAVTLPPAVPPPAVIPAPPAPAPAPTFTQSVGAGTAASAPASTVDPAPQPPASSATEPTASLEPIATPSP